MATPNALARLNLGNGCKALPPADGFSVFVTGRIRDKDEEWCCATCYAQALHGKKNEALDA